MVQRHVMELATVTDKLTYLALLERHAFEAHIFPQRNIWRIGNRVQVNGHGEGTIEHLTCNGTVCVAFDGNLPRDFHWRALVNP